MALERQQLLGSEKISASLSALRQELECVQHQFPLASVFNPPQSLHTALSQLREVFYSLLLNFKACAQDKSERDLFPLPIFRTLKVLPVLYSLFDSSLHTLSRYCSQVEVLMLIRESAENLCECMIRELRKMGVCRKALLWMRDGYMLLDNVGRVFQGLAWRFIPREVDLQQVFEVVFYEKIQRDRLVDSVLELAKTGVSLLDREIQEMQSDLAKAAKAPDQPKAFKVNLNKRQLKPLSQARRKPETKTHADVETMSLDDLVLYINKSPAGQREKDASRLTTACTSKSPQQHDSDDFGEEIQRFRDRLENVHRVGRKLKPAMSEDWVHKLECRAIQEQCAKS